jgi:TolB-like protein/lipoprotein NlpI
MAIAIGLPIALLALWLLNPGGWRNRFPAGGRDAPIDAVAVLPIENMSRNADQEYFADGMTDELITSLGRISALRVIARSSVMSYKGTHKSLREIARDLNVAAVLEGSVLESKDKVRITAQLVRATTGQLLWSDSYERDLSDVITLQSEVAMAIAQQIQVKLTPQERVALGRTTPVNPAAHEAYLRGRYLWNGSTRAEKERGIEFLQRAVQLDPGYAMGYVGLADAYYSVSNWWMPPQKAVPLARTALAHALKLDPDLAEAHAIAGVLDAVYDYDFPAAEQELRRGVESNPNASTARLWYGYFLTAAGRYAEAHQQMDAARALDPLASYLRFLATWPSYYEGDYDRAITECRAILEMDSSSADSHTLIGESYEQKHDYPRALAELETAERLGTHAWTLAAIGRVYAESGHRDSALAVARRLGEFADHVDPSNYGYITPYGVATIYSALGDFEHTTEWLERGYRERSEDCILIGVDPRMSRVRADPRLADWMRRHGFPNPATPPPSPRS